MSTKSSESLPNITLKNEFLRYLSSDRLGLIILPTEQCNFRCLYCYERFDIGKMKPELVEGIKKFIEKRLVDLKFLNIEWFGGEPLLAYTIVKDIMSHTIRHIEKINNQIVLVGNMTTNAFFLDINKLEDLVSLGIQHYQITLDGNTEEHDKLRASVGGEKTFDTIWRNLQNAHKSELKFIITLRLHVNSNNAESMKSLIFRIASEIGSDSRFELFIRPISRLGGQNDAILPITRDPSICNKLKKYAEICGLKIAMESYGESPVCYASMLNSFVIRADGRIAKCTTALYDDKNTVGTLNPDGMLSIDKDKLLWWARGLFSGNSDELHCPANIYL